MRKDKIGSIWVDSGTILIADPCHVIPGKGEPPKIDYDRLGELFYAQGRRYTEPAVVIAGEEIIPAGERVERALHVTIPSEGDGVGGIVVGVGCDGWFPVFLEKDQDGEPLRIIIELGGQVKP